MTYILYPSALTYSDSRPTAIFVNPLSSPTRVFARVYVNKPPFSGVFGPKAASQQDLRRNYGPFADAVIVLPIMADVLPNALQLREIKYGEKVTNERRRAVGRAFESAGRLAEALDLFLIAGDDEGVLRLRQRGVAEGRTILLVMLERAGRAPTAQEWSQAADASFSAGRYRDAYRCFQKAGDEAGIERVKEKDPGLRDLHAAGQVAYFASCFRWAAYFLSIAAQSASLFKPKISANAV